MTRIIVGGDGAVVDVSNATARYRVLLSEDGSILQAFRQEPGETCRITDRHHNTGDTPTVLYVCPTASCGCKTERIQ